MDKREKLIQGLKCCVCDDTSACERCGYIDDGCLENIDNFKAAILRDALEVLTATERVKTKHNNGITHWYATSECDASVDPGDEYCPKCGRKLV